jgi:uncharacterized protein (DUF4415 family)
MIIGHEIDVKPKTNKNLLPNWYKSSERAMHPHPKKLKVECSLDEDVVQWLKGKTTEDEEYTIYINHYLRKIMNSQR